MPSIDDKHYDEIIELFMEFRKMDDDDVAIAFLQNRIKQKVREYTRGAISFSELKDGEKCILLPMNGFDCCRKDGMRYPEETYVLLEKYTADGKGKARAVSTGTDYEIPWIDLVLKIL